MICLTIPLTMILEKTSAEIDKLEKDFLSLKIQYLYLKDELTEI